jgi:hypothetical protein
MDSNFQYASTERWHRATDLLLFTTVKRRSAGRPPPMARPRSEAGIPASIRRQTWYLAFGTRKGWAQMPHADYDDGLVPRLRDSQDGKGGYGAPGADFSRVGSRAGPVCWQFRCRSGEKTISSGFKTDRSAAVHARLFSRRLAIRAAN